MKRKILVLTVLSLMWSVACTPAGVAVRTAVTAGKVVAQDRSTATALNDSKIALEVSESLFRYDIETFRKLSVTTYEGRVLLTGVVKTAENRAQAVRLSWKAAGVRDVINEIEVRASGDLIDAAQDIWISTRLRSKLLFDGGVSSVNYVINTTNARIYLIGFAQSQAEKDRVIAYARDVPYVRRVVSYIRVKKEQNKK